MAQQRLSISIDSEVLSQVKDEATKDRRTLSGMIEVILADYLKVKK